MAKKTIERKVAETILQKNKQIEIGGVTYEVAPPSIATLILVSEQLSLCPAIPITKEPEHIISWTLKHAKDCSFLGDLLAILILGAKGLTEKVEKKKFFGLIKTTASIDRQAELKEMLLCDLKPSEFAKLCAELLNGMEIGDFFVNTTFLLEVNLLKQTKVD